MINIRTLNRIADENDLSIRIEKRDIPQGTLDYELGYGRQYDISGFDSNRFEELIEAILTNSNFFFQSTYIRTLLTLTE